MIRVVWAVVCGVVCFGGSLLGQENTELANPRQRLAAEFVRTALRFEIDGEMQWRDATLRAALTHAPDLGPAHWQLGRVQAGKIWQTAEEAWQHASDDKQLAEYQRRRALAADNPEKQYDLAQWCRRAGFTDRAEVHYLRVLLDPQTSSKTRAAAFDKLDLRFVAGRWLKPEQLEQERQFAVAAQQAIDRWRGKFDRWRSALEGKSGRVQRAAEQQLRELDNPEVIPVIETFVIDPSAAFQGRLIDKLDGFPQYEATQTLVRFALLSPHAAAREQAAQALSRRPLHDFTPTLLDALTAPLELQYKIVRLPNGMIHYQHVLAAELKDRNVVVVREDLARPVLGAVEVVADDSLLAGRSETELQDPRGDADWQLFSTAIHARESEREVGIQNTATAFRNRFVFEALERSTGQLLERRPGAWWDWWQDYNALLQPKPTYVDYKASTSTYSTDATQRMGTRVQPASVIPNQPGGGRRRIANRFQRRHSCFVGGTLVWTETGLKAIEDVQVGDRVLSQSPDTGELAFKVVRDTTVGAPASGVVRTSVAGDQVTMTEAHVVWTVGEGWQIARNLQAGDRLRTVSGALPVDQTEKLPAPPLVFNLIVDEFNTYFVGRSGLLVHDITTRKPTRSILPGLWDE